MFIPEAIPEIGDKVAGQLSEALRKALEVLQIPTKDEFDAIKDKIADISEIVDDLNQRCEDLAYTEEDEAE